jgi:hypothetical protein
MIAPAPRRGQATDSERHHVIAASSRGRASVTTAAGSAPKPPTGSSPRRRFDLAQISLRSAVAASRLGGLQNG